MLRKLVHILCVEYPGYGQYKGSPTSAQIIKDAETVFDFLIQEIGYEPKNILVFGRSIGSGPATHLASTKNTGKFNAARFTILHFDLAQRALDCQGVPPSAAVLVLIETE